MTKISKATNIEFASKETLVNWIMNETGKNIKTDLVYNWEGKVIFKVIKNKRQEVPKFEVIIK
jgi:ABC-type tungstate transport system permease subunit